MNRKFFLCAAVAALALTTTATSYASLRHIYVGDEINLTLPSYRQGSGGEFVVNKISPTSFTDYTHTYCAEIGETFNSGETMLVKSVGLTSESSMPVNTLTSRAAKLYFDYCTGIAASSYGFIGNTGASFGLAGGTFTFDVGGTGGSGGTRSDDGRDVQLALWSMIGESVTLTTGASALVTWYGTNVAENGNYYGVRIANLVYVDANGNYQERQDQFVTIPEPGSLLIWVGSVGLAGMFTRRKRVD